MDGRHAEAVAGSLLETLARVLPAGALLTRREDLAPHVTDWRGHVRGEALAVALPGTTDEVAAVVRACAGARVPIVPQGGNTSLCEAAVPGADGPAPLVVNLRRMRRVRLVDTASNAIVVEAGVTLAEVQAAAAEAERLFPLSMGSEGSAQVGGFVSTNAGGTAVVRYGTTRDLVLGIEAVLPDGEVWDGLRRLRKDNTGYDLKQLFVGAEGTLGLVTAACLKLFPRPRETALAWVAVASPAHAVELLGILQGRFDTRLTAFEMLSGSQVRLTLAYLPGGRAPVSAEHPWHVLVELSDPLAGAGLDERLAEALAQAAEADLVVDAALAQSLDQGAAMWRVRHALSDANREHGVSVTLDVAVPTSEAPAFVAAADALLTHRFPEAEPLVVAHLGDGNVHYVVQYAHARWRAIGGGDALKSEILAALHDVAVARGGTISAEHGIGTKLRAELARHKAPVELALMRRVKTALDPADLMNPGKLL